MAGQYLSPLMPLVADSREPVYRWDNNLTKIFGKENLLILVWFLMKIQFPFHNENEDS
jgi:hypothetical protein